MKIGYRTHDYKRTNIHKRLINDIIDKEEGIIDDWINEI
jgi:hypothetical protein